mmetsp:Transcript_42606/g.97742  ORF Transcript_42606/g.97742 Transcript_42606/m.97742 type:complete len:233 (+) Transcript_42606:55-753(+)
MPSLVVLPGLWSVLVCIEGMRVDMPIEHNSSLTKPSQEAHICDREHRGVQCVLAPISWPVFQHLYAQTVMNADLAKIHGIEHGQDLVAAAWEDYKVRCPDGWPAEGVLQPCHTFPPANVGGMRLGQPPDCISAERTGGRVAWASIADEGKVLGEVCTTFQVVKVDAAKRIGKLQDTKSNLCLAELLDLDLDEPDFETVDCEGPRKDIQWQLTSAGWCLIQAGGVTTHCLGMA